jgi:hypothetical protein
MTTFNRTELLKYDLNPLLVEQEDLALIVDDYTLAHNLRTTTRMMWFAILNRKSLYTTFEIPKKTGGFRSIQAPRPYIKRILSRLYKKVLTPLHNKLGPHVTGYRSGFGTKLAVLQHIYPCELCDGAEAGKTAASHVCPRNGTYIKLDLKNFFHSTRKWWVEDYLMSVGYGAYVSDLMAELMTVPGLPHPRDAEKRVIGVPQGSPTSGAICNLVAAQRIDTPVMAYLAALNAESGLDSAWEWRYTRYADDIAITCGKRVHPRHRATVLREVFRLIQKSGYSVNPKKTKIKTGRKQRKLLGLVFNQKPNIERKDYLRLRATVFNCLVHGIDSQAARAGYENPAQFASWLRGKINYVKHIHPDHGEKLYDVFHDAVMTHYPEWIPPTP